jgi:hypothetical protein
VFDPTREFSFLALSLAFMLLFFAGLAAGNDGDLDLTWGPLSGGRAVTDVTGIGSGRAMVVQGDGKVVVVGKANQNGDFVVDVNGYFQ